MKKSADQDKGKPHKEKTFRNKSKRKSKRKKANVKQTKRTIEHSLRQEKPYPAAGKSPSVVPVPLSHPSRPRSIVPQVKNAHNVWIKTYQNIVKWQFQHQVNYWKQHALQLREDNARLRRRLAVQDSEDEDDEEATAREQQQKQGAAAAADDDENDSLDEEFIAFMEVSARHRLERRRLKNESVH